MKLAKSLLLGSAAGFVAIGAAQAADLPAKKAAAVEYVKVCEWTAAAGPGFFYIPGTDTCLRLSGAVRAEYTVTSIGKWEASTSTTAANTKTHNDTGFFARGKIEADARTQTSYGTLRSFVRLQGDRAVGNAAANDGSASSSSVSLDKGFIQWGPITAGRVGSAFDFGADPYGFGAVPTSDSSTEAFQYTATLGGGLTATLSIEDPASRRGSIINAGGGAVSYGGTRIPDVVGQFAIAQGWGGAQLSAAYHQVNTTLDSTHSVDTDGFAFRGGIKVNLPMLGAGDEFQIEAGWEKGAFSYQNSNGINSGWNGYAAGGYIHPVGDAVALSNGAGGYTLAKSEGYSVSGGIVHYFSPQWSDTVYGGFEHASWGKAANVAWTSGGVGSVDDYRIGNQINWYPVKNVQIGLDTLFTHIDQKIPQVAKIPLAAGVKQNPDGFEARLRLERDF